MNYTNDERLYEVARREFLKGVADDLAEAHVPVEEIALWLDKLIEVEAWQRGF